jgi:hypothetical protein
VFLEDGPVSDDVRIESKVTVSWWQPVLFAAMAGGMAWGIRGQYGHETGAMMAGSLVSLALAYLLCPGAKTRDVIRVVAWTTAAMGIGGSMTYGQTLGLTQNPVVLGNWEALRWGLLGCSIKGAMWIGFAGLFLGIGLGGKRYRASEMFMLLMMMLGAYFLGVLALNMPHNFAKHELPEIYFSDHWYWNPDVTKPRPECWGGLLFAYLVGVLYTGMWRKDGLASRMALWGLLGGALGFPLGQCVQAFHAWNPQFFVEGQPFWDYTRYFNWWNMMETTFGAVMGATLGFGAWFHRKRIAFAEMREEHYLLAPAEWALLGLHVFLLYGEQLFYTSHLSLLSDSFPAFLYAMEAQYMEFVKRFYDLGLLMCVLPMMFIAGGRRAPFLMALPVTILPIAGKTLYQLCYNPNHTRELAYATGWLLYLIIPMTLAVGAAIWFMRDSEQDKPSRSFTRPAMLLAAWTFFYLNNGFFESPWPWKEWTGRTPNGLIFLFCAIGLTVMVFLPERREKEATLEEE